MFGEVFGILKGGPSPDLPPTADIGPDQSEDPHPNFQIQLTSPHSLILYVLVASTQKIRYICIAIPYNYDKGVIIRGLYNAGTPPPKESSPLHSIIYYG